MQKEKAAAPVTAEAFPGGHEIHCSSDAAPGMAEYVPFLQGVQTSESSAPTTSEKEPKAHGAQSVLSGAFANLPEGQISQTALCMELATLPASHGTHVPGVEAPICAEEVPTGHGWQSSSAYAPS